MWKAFTSELWHCLCRVLTERAAEEHPCMAACLKVSQAILTADGDTVAAANSADAPANEAMAMAHVAPALWRVGFATTVLLATWICSQSHKP